MIAITYELCAVQPLLLTRLEGDPNSAISYPYVPGSAVRGALANRHFRIRRREAGADYDPMTDQSARRLFFDGTTRYLNAYPLDHKRVRTLPAPLSWFYEKERGLKPGVSVYDFSVAMPRQLKQPKSVGSGFVRRFRDGDGDDEEKWALRPATVQFTDPVWEINVHTARERRRGRATEEEGGIFRYQALAPVTRLGGVVLVANKADAGIVDELLRSGDLWLGGSRSAGYGRAEVSAIDHRNDWSETGTDLRDLAPGARLVLTLLSDALVRRHAQAGGGYADRLVPALLPTPLHSALELTGTYKQVSLVGGFNRKWGLPLVQTPALQAGSVFVYRVTAPVSAGDLRAIERDGVGERRAEGFGRVAANWHGDEWLLVQDVPASRMPPEEVVLTGQEEELARAMVERLLRRELDRLLDEAIMSQRAALTVPEGASAQSTLSKTQIARLRTLALNALPAGDAARMIAFLLDANLNPPARDQLRQARIDGERLLDWLAQRFANALPADRAGQLLALLECLAQEEAPFECRLSETELQGLLKWLGRLAARMLSGISSSGVAALLDDDAGRASELAALLTDDEWRALALARYREPSINGVALRELLRERIDRPTSIWEWLHAQEIEMPRIGNVAAIKSDELVREYTLRLVEGVLHRAAKERAND